MLQILVFDELDSLSEDFYSKVFAFLPKQRQEKINKLDDLKKKNQKAVVYFLLVQALFKETKSLVLPALSEENKPTFLSNPNLHFSLSHTDSSCACCLADFEVGMDIQTIVEVNPSLLSHVCSEEEIKQIQLSTNPKELFIELWTRKESYLKLFGKSIMCDLKKIPTEDTEDVHFFSIKRKNNVLSICYKNQER